MSKKKLHPEWSTVVMPVEYDIEKQMESWLNLANTSHAWSMDIDVGKFWGLYTSWLEARKLLTILALGVSFGDTCPFCSTKDGHTEICNFNKWMEENVASKH